jgi:RHS repeat-associated protein
MVAAVKKRSEKASGYAESLRAAPRCLTSSTDVYPDGDTAVAATGMFNPANRRVSRKSVESVKSADRSIPPFPISGIRKLRLGLRRRDLDQPADASGKVVQTFHYDSFGNALGFTPSSAITQYLYTQQYYDQFSSTYYDWARNYNTATGSFTQADYGNYGSLNDPMSMLPYAFTGGDPINMLDLNGHFSLSATLAVTGLSSLLISIAVPGIHGAWESAYHVTASGTTESLFSAIFEGDVTPSDWERVLSGLGGGAGAGAVNVLDALTFHQVNPLDQYRNELWKQQGLDNSWVGSTADGFAWAGTGLLYSAAAVWTWGAFGGGTMDIAVTRGAAPFYIHVLYGVNGAWQSAVLGTGLLGLGGMTIVNEAAGTAESGFQLTGIPVLRPGLVLAGNEAGYAYSCVTAALHAFVRGWGGW